jgi:hypothetical protein
LVWYAMHTSGGANLRDLASAQASPGLLQFV